MDKDGGKDEDEDEGVVEGPGGPTNARIQMKVSTRADNSPVLLVSASAPMLKCASAGRSDTAAGETTGPKSSREAVPLWAAVLLGKMTLDQPAVCPWLLLRAPALL